MNKEKELDDMNGVGAHTACRLRTDSVFLASWASERGTAQQDAARRVIKTPWPPISSHYQANAISEICDNSV